MQGVETIKELKSEVKKFVKYYNERRLHSSHNYQTPLRVYKNCLAENDDKYFELYCDIATHSANKEKSKLKYEKLNTQKYVA